MNIIVNDILNDRKINDIKDKYIEFANKESYKTNNILLLVPNNKIKFKYNKLINLKVSEEINISTYNSFLIKEVVKFWPIIQQKYNNIISHKVKPSIINSSLTDYILNKIVKEKRTVEGFFNDITASNRNIASSISFNINKGCQSLIDLNDIGNRIYYSKHNQSKLDRFSYSQMQEIINEYLDLLVKNSTMDNSIAIYLYNEFLLKDEEYVNNLRRRVNYLIVDSLENCTASEVDFIDTLLDSVKESYMYINQTKDYAAFNNVDMKYIKDKLFDKCKFIKNSEASEVNISELFKLNKDIELNQNIQLYSQMLIEVSNKVVELINKGYRAKDIAIISPINNTITEYEIKNILLKNNIGFYSTKQDKRIVDYPYAHALMVASCIFYECEELLNNEDYINFISLLLNTNKIRAKKVLSKKLESDKYNEIINYIRSKKSDDVNIYEFLIKFYIDKLLELPKGKENVKICKKIIQESENFTENISLLGINNNKSKEKIFIEALKSSIKDYYTLLELEDFKDEDLVVLTTPYTYISHNMKNDMQIWLDIGSNMWSMKSEKEISNVHVLKKSFIEGNIYTEDIEEFYKEYYLKNTIYNLLLNTEKVYAYKSEYTVNGYIQEGSLYGLILKLIDKGDFNGNKL
ncbi:hypothetical protein C672_0718 [[Clostridium] bifermentans ATCC 638]|uniref:Uncharacterized protein n=1 Tax=Paraclostridium bifermentans ATCC 638 = DSM 14991 TaxID=1233171 RepID=T4VKX9_PARBF|nr:hypothetical protein [Paraclostridium bifermentans]EQK41780.1 hypothetical protein C672_0718 [[Clostridium] bifermentans ATCC 638] [Paraclostridium bifermentans ATCC 638 = DSM 14991]RIZ59110.1 hypothetical protein CHH45_06605 [Paraclostridium bifermentans]UAG18662.1 hypothetical protein KXZ80_02840 [Paraclostridium bifermentans]